MIIKEIDLSRLLEKSLEEKKHGRRLAQICAAFIDGKQELSYSFADDTTYEFLTYRIVVEPGTPVPTITEIFSNAVFYENEMNELFGVNVRMLPLDYHDKLYRTKVVAPYVPENIRDEVLAHQDNEEEPGGKSAETDDGENTKTNAAETGGGGSDMGAGITGAGGNAATKKEGE